MSRLAPLSARKPDFDGVHSSAVGQRLGAYTVCAELASGGMATVYLAREASPGPGARAVALKVVHRHLARCSEFVDMFVDEARISAQIQHPNVCQVLSFDGAGETYYLAMEYLLGETVSAVFQRSSERPLDLGRFAALVTRVAADACLGLHAAHTLKSASGHPLNVVHRDVSPDNLFVTYDGRTKVVDFGLASTKHQTHRSQSGIIKGKFAYVSPEALNGAKVGRKADIWSLGVVVWELLTGRRLFRTDSDLQTLAAVAGAPIPAPSSVRPGLPKELDAPVLRALSRKPSLRQATAAQFRAELLAACPLAAEMAEADVAAWMAQLFSDERRAKTQALAAVESFSSEPPLAEAEPSSNQRRQRAKICRESRQWGFAAAVLAILVGAGALTRSSLSSSNQRKSAPLHAVLHASEARATAFTAAVSNASTFASSAQPAQVSHPAGEHQERGADSAHDAQQRQRVAAVPSALRAKGRGRVADDPPPAWLRRVMSEESSLEPLTLAARGTIAASGRASRRPKPPELRD